MFNQSMRQGLIVAASVLAAAGVIAASSVLLLAGCSARSEVSAAPPVHASAAQRIEIGPADETAVTSASVPAAPTAALRADLAAGEEIHLPDGTVGVKVAKQYFHTIVVCRQRDGSFSTQCPASQEPSR
jgi:hypothetical protein